MECEEASVRTRIKNPVRDWDSKNGAKETRTPDPLLTKQGVRGAYRQTAAAFVRPTSRRQCKT